MLCTYHEAVLQLWLVCPFIALLVNSIMLESSYRFQSKACPFSKCYFSLKKRKKLIRLNYIIHLICGILISGTISYKPIFMKFLNVSISISSILYLSKVWIDFMEFLFRLE